MQWATDRPREKVKGVTGMIRFGWRRQLGVMLLPMALATGAYGLTAANTVPDNDAGDGTVAVTGYTVSVIDYNLNATDPYDIDSVDFLLTADDGSYERPDTIKVRLDVSSNVWYACAGQNDATATAETFLCDTTVGTQAKVVDVDELRVVAAE